MAQRDDSSIPTGRVRRTAEVGSALGTEGARYAGTRAANLARSPEAAAKALDRRHLEAAERMVQTLGRMKGAAMKVGQLASFIDTEFLPPEYRELYQEQLATLRSSAPPMPWKKVERVLREEWDEPVDELFERFDREAAAAASIGQVHRAALPDGREVAVKVQYPGVADAIRADMQNAGLIMRMAKALAPGLDAKAAAEELKERVMEELDYELEAQSQRAFARGYRDHPFIHVPEVVTRLSTTRVLVSEWVDGVGFDEVAAPAAPERDRFGEIVFRFCFGSIYHLQHFNADAHPGNYLLMPDGRVAFLDFGMTKQLDSDQIELEVAALAAVFADDPERLRVALHDLGFLRDPKKVDAEQLMQHVRRDRRLVHGGRRGDGRLGPGDGCDRRRVRPALRVLPAGAPREPARQRAHGPAHGDRAPRGAGPARSHAELAPDRARMVVRRAAGHRARRGRKSLLRGPR